MSFLNGQIADWFVTVGKRNNEKIKINVLYLPFYAFSICNKSHVRLHITEVPVCHIIQGMLVAIHYQLQKMLLGELRHE